MADEPTAAEPAKRKTEYVILASIDGGKTWTVEGRRVASSRPSALSHFYEERPLPSAPEDPESEGEPIHPSEYALFQAVPSSSWKTLRPADPRPRVPFAEVDG